MSYTTKIKARQLKSIKRRVSHSFKHHARKEVIPSVFLSQWRDHMIYDAYETTSFRLYTQLLQSGMFCSRVHVIQGQGSSRYVGIGVGGWAGCVAISKGYTFGYCLLQGKDQAWVGQYSQRMRPCLLKESGRWQLILWLSEVGQREL